MHSEFRLLKMLFRDMLFTLQRATGILDEKDILSFESLLLSRFTDIKKISVFFFKFIAGEIFYHHSKTLL